MGYDFQTVVQRSIVLDVGQMMILIEDVQQVPCIGAEFSGFVNLQFDPKVSGTLTVENGVGFIGVVVDRHTIFQLLIAARTIGRIFIIV